jgi:hypothetical protein
MSAQDLADRLEADAIQRYLLMRSVWWPCWGAAAKVPRRTQPRR